MATIKKVEEFKKANNKKSWKFTMDDGTQGYSHPNNPEKPWEYKEGDKVDVKIENKGTYNLLIFTRIQQTPTQTDVIPPPKSPPMSQTEEEKFKINPPLQQDWGKMSFDEMKFELRKELIGTLGQIVVAGKIETKELTEFYNEIYPALDLSIDVLKK